MVTHNVALVGLVTGLAAVYGCSSGDGGRSRIPSPVTGGASGSPMGTGGTGGTVGSGGTGGTTSTGGTVGTGDAGDTSDASDTSDAGDTSDASDTSDAGNTSDATGMGDIGGADGGVSADDITKVVPTAGCGSDPQLAIGTAVRGTIQTMGTKPPGCADSRCGAWSYEREYFITLPQGYVSSKAYPLIIQGPGCAVGGTAVYPLNSNVDNTVIRVSLKPPPDTIGHATNPNQGCFDDKEGDDSIEWVFYENLYDKLAAQLCFDKNRVFASGNSSGAWLANELGCKYAGDATRPIRGVLPNTGGLPTDPRYVPTCTTKPMAGMWVWEIDSNGSTAFAGNQVAIARAMKVNECTMGSNYDNAPSVDFPIGGGNPGATCKKILGCPDLYPLVACVLPGNAQSAHDSVVNPGFSTFIKLFSMPPLLTP